MFVVAIILIVCTLTAVMLLFHFSLPEEGAQRALKTPAHRKQGRIDLREDNIKTKVLKPMPLANLATHSTPPTNSDLHSIHLHNTQIQNRIGFESPLPELSPNRFFSHWPGGRKLHHPRKSRL